MTEFHSLDRKGQGREKKERKKERKRKKKVKKKEKKTEKRLYFLCQS